MSAGHTSGVRIPDCSKLSINWKMTMTSLFGDKMSSSRCHRWRWRVSLLRFSYCCKFQVNIITGSGVMAVFYKGLARNLEIENTIAWVLFNIWRLGWVRVAKFGSNVSNEKLINAANCQVYSFYWFWVIKGKPRTMGRRSLVF